MKHFIILTILCVAFLRGSSQNEKYMSMMKTVVATLDTARVQETFQNVANTLERIAAKETKEWLPDYYLAFCNVRMAS